MKLEIHRFGVLSARHSHPLVFIHGEWHGAWCWEEKFVPFFRRHGFLCVTMDLRGHGGSEGAERLNDWRLEDYVADLAQMVDEVGQDPILVGHSMGATVSQIFASQHLVVGMALLCPIPIMGYHDDAVRLFKGHPWISFLAEVTKNAGRLGRGRRIGETPFPFRKGTRPGCLPLLLPAAGRVVEGDTTMRRWRGRACFVPRTSDPCDRTGRGRGGLAPERASLRRPVSCLRGDYAWVRS